MRGWGLFLGHLAVWGPRTLLFCEAVSLPLVCCGARPPTPSPHPPLWRTDHDIFPNLVKGASVARYNIVICFLGCWSRLHSKLCNINSLNVILSLISWIPRERMSSIQISLFIVMFPSSYITGSDIEINHQRIQVTRSHTSHCHRCIVIIAMLTLCYSTISHSTLILFHHTSMLTPHNSLISHTLWLPHAWCYGVLIVFGWESRFLINAFGFVRFGFGFLMLKPSLFNRLCRWVSSMRILWKCIIEKFRNFFKLGMLRICLEHVIQELIDAQQIRHLHSNSN